MGWLLSRYGDLVSAEHARVRQEAERTQDDPYIACDKMTKDILKDNGERVPSADTVAEYRRTMARLMKNQNTPADVANTLGSYNKLRSAWRYAEAEAIKDLRRASERARKAGNLNEARSLTYEAWARAVVFHALCLDADRPTWAARRREMEGQGLKIKSKSKRASARRAPTPDALLVSMMGQRRNARVELLAALVSVYGVRPSELTKGVRLAANGHSLRVKVAGVKVDAVRGQVSRTLVVSQTGAGQSGLAVRLLAQHTGQTITATPADLKALWRALNEVQPGLSAYSYRHARASDVKAASGGNRKMVAEWLGHANDKSQSAYGYSRSSRGAVAIEAAKGSREVRSVKTLPGQTKRPTRPVVPTMSAKIAARRMVKPRTAASPLANGPKLPAL